MSHNFSIIVPAYNEERYLSHLIKSINTARSNYTRGSVEIIVADNSSTDGTTKLAESLGAKVVTVEKRCIAASRNGEDAAAATGDVVCFIDADSAVHVDTFNKIDDAMSDNRFVAGATGVDLERWSVGLLATYLMMLPMLWITGMDTGVVFCRREDFVSVGGYNEDLYFAEDVTFLYTLKQLGATRGQRLSRLSGVRALGCTRKFDEHGDWHYFAMLPSITLMLIRKGWTVFVAQEDMPEFNKYWYGPQR